MENNSFVLDIVVTHLESPEITDMKTVQVQASFGKTKVIISPSRINVSEFKPGAGIDIIETPKKLRKSLEECGLALTVSYKNKVIGAGQLSLPQKNIDSIEKGMRDLIYMDSCSFEREGQTIGKIDVLLRFISKCDELTK